MLHTVCLQHGVPGQVQRRRVEGRACQDLENQLQDTAVNRFFSFLGQMTIELYIIHLLGRRLLPFTGFYNEKSHLHYFIMLACSVGLAYGFHKLNNLLSARIEKALL